jgi:hypothetical protein
MNRGRSIRTVVVAVGALAAVLIAMSPASAAPRRLDCSLTVLETKAGPKLDVAAEKRAIIVVFDEQAKALTVRQDGGARALGNVTMTQSSMTGYVDEMSLGVDPSSWSVVLQTYKPDSMDVEFGACALSAQPPP